MPKTYLKEIMMFSLSKIFHWIKVQIQPFSFFAFWRNTISFILETARNDVYRKPLLFIKISRALCHSEVSPVVNHVTLMWFTAASEWSGQFFSSGHGKLMVGEAGIGTKFPDRGFVHCGLRYRRAKRGDFCPLRSTHPRLVRSQWWLVGD